MFTTSVLFGVLSVLAHCSPAFADASTWRQGFPPADNQPCYADGKFGLLDGALCVVADAAITKRSGLLGGGLLGSDQGYRPTGPTPYGFGWFHPGAFQAGDRCWQNDREGSIIDALCVIAEINIGDGNSQPFNGWFDKPYYGYGHRFGWYHPGPYLNGDRCTQDGRDGIVQNSLCVDVDATTGRGTDGGLLKGLNLGRRNVWGPDYWAEPRFSPDNDFGWFHDGPFANGDRCWSDGWYGTVTDSSCLLAKVDVNLKRDTLGLTDILNGAGRSSYTNSERCFKNGVWGRWWHNDCNIIADDSDNTQLLPFKNGDKCWRAGSWGIWSGSDCSLLGIDLNLKRHHTGVPSFSRLGQGIPCNANGHEGVLRDAVCVVAELDVNLKRDHDEEVAHGVKDSFEGASYADDEDEENDEDVEPAQPGSEEEEYDEQMERRLLGYEMGQNHGNAVGKTVSKVLKGIKTRDLLNGLGGLGGAGGSREMPDLKQLKQLDQLNQLSQLNQLGGLTGSRKSGVKSDGLLGNIVGGGLLGKRDFGHTDTQKLSELMESIGLARRSQPTSEMAARELHELLHKITSMKSTGSHRN